jgi:CheY-like chemotaxis protein
VFTLEFVATAATAEQERELAASRQEQERRSGALANQFETERASASLSGLVTDDNGPIRRLVSTVLAKAGHKVDTATNGQEAVEKCWKKVYDFILMDMHMPIMNGVEASAAIRKEEGERNAPPVPIIAVTADLQEQAKKKCFEVGVNSVMAKPINWAELLNEIRALSGQTERTETDSVPAPSSDGPQDSGGDVHFEDFPSLAIETVQGLEDALGADVIHPMLVNFRSSLEAHIEALDGYCSAGDLDKARKEGHAINGLCRQFGALRSGEIGAHRAKGRLDQPDRTFD